jgi:hypothetical protein
METINTARTVYIYDGIKCLLRFGRYANGAHQLSIVDYYNEGNIANCTINMAKDGVRVSSFNSSILIKTWGENEGIYKFLRDQNIISKKTKEVSVGLNVAYECELLIKPQNE